MAEGDLYLETLHQVFAMYVVLVGVHQAIALSAVLLLTTLAPYHDHHQQQLYGGLQPWF